MQRPNLTLTLRSALTLMPILTSAGALKAESWQFLPDVKLRAADVYMSTRRPADQYGSTFKALQGALGLKREDATSVWLTRAELESAEANNSSYGATDLKTHYAAREKTALTRFDLGYRYTHGFEPLSQPIEEAAIRDARSFESLYAGVYQQLSLDAQNDFGVFLGGGKNAEGLVQTDTRDAQISWDHHHNVAWTTRLRMRATDGGSKQREIIAEELLRYDEKLSAEISYGYGWETEDDNKSGGLLWGLALQYQTRSLLAPLSAYSSLTPAKDISPEETESLRGSSVYRLGWTHSRDQRRIGDPYYYADIFYASARVLWAGNQSFEFKGSHARASEQKVLDTLNDYRSEIMAVTYDWSHRFLTRYPDATLGLGYSVEQTELPPRRFFREAYQLSYRLQWY